MKPEDVFSLDEIKEITLSPELKEMIKATVQAGEIALSMQSGQLDVKDIEGHGFVTLGDLKVTEFLHQRVPEIFPQATILSEEREVEFGGKPRDEVVVIDPIDGTGWYKDGGDLWTVTMGYVKNNNVEMAVTFRPRTNELWFGQLGKGSYCLEAGKLERLKVKEETDFSQIKIGVGAAFIPREKRIALNRYLPLIVDQFRSPTIIESSALSLALIAQGVSLSGHIDPHAKPWDKVAGMLLIEEADGIVTGWPGRDDIWAEGLIAASNQTIYNRLLQIAKTI